MFILFCFIVRSGLCAIFMCWYFGYFFLQITLKVHDLRILLFVRETSAESGYSAVREPDLAICVIRHIIYIYMSRMDTERIASITHLYSHRITKKNEDPAHNRRQDTMYITGT